MKDLRAKGYARTLKVTDTKRSRKVVAVVELVVVVLVEDTLERLFPLLRAEFESHVRMESSIPGALSVEPSAI